MSHDGHVTNTNLALVHNSCLVHIQGWNSVAKTEVYNYSPDFNFTKVFTFVISPAEDGSWSVR